MRGGPCAGRAARLRQRKEERRCAARQRHPGSAQSLAKDCTASAPSGVTLRCSSGTAGGISILSPPPLSFSALARSLHSFGSFNPTLTAWEGGSGEGGKRKEGFGGAKGAASGAGPDGRGSALPGGAHGGGDGARPGLGKVLPLGNGKNGNLKKRGSFLPSCDRCRPQPESGWGLGAGRGPVRPIPRGKRRYPRALPKGGGDLGSAGAEVTGMSLGRKLQPGWWCCTT